MYAFALILYIYAGPFAKGDSVTVHSVPMQSMELCQRAGQQAASLTNGSAKEYRFVCVQTGK